MKILSARAERTFDQGIREYIVLVKLDDNKERIAYHIWSNKFPPINGKSNNKQYRFESGSDAAECAEWLIGREYIGPDNVNL